ncbi:hypothetical protein BpHYR1_033350 [Brachionus plicatilis]|uniref:Uncharacterized protein n=1 Tax=Brachionus plicatilis TaxID=10195 RepID=A0A3M7PX59_BRAPC|nr:hypothetical protein BpHYR1_033350 [Brachionus plicatilis]
MNLRKNQDSGSNPARKIQKKTSSRTKNAAASAASTNAFKDKLEKFRYQQLATNDTTMVEH